MYSKQIQRRFWTFQYSPWSKLELIRHGREGYGINATAIKQEVRLQEWSAQIDAQQASGLTVQQWCAQNGVNPKTYYYHLKKVQSQYLESAPAIVPLTVPKHSLDIRIEKNGLQISLPTDVNPETLLALVRELC